MAQSIRRWDVVLNHIHGFGGGGRRRSSFLETHELSAAQLPDRRPIYVFKSQLVGHSEGDLGCQMAQEVPESRKEPSAGSNA